MALCLDHKQFARCVMGEGPADRDAIVFGNQENAIFFGVAALRLAPMLQGEIRIPAAIGLKRRLMVLQSVDEGQDRRFVGGQTGFPDTNGPAP
jgi:hypothetical protein